MNYIARGMRAHLEPSEHAPHEAARDHRAEDAELIVRVRVRGQVRVDVRLRVRLRVAARFEEARAAGHPSCVRHGTQLHHIIQAGCKGVVVIHYQGTNMVHQERRQVWMGYGWVHARTRSHTVWTRGIIPPLIARQSPSARQSGRPGMLEGDQEDALQADRAAGTG